MFCNEDLAKANFVFPSLFKDLLSQNAPVPKVGLAPGSDRSRSTLRGVGESLL